MVKSENANFSLADTPPDVPPGFSPITCAASAYAAAVAQSSGIQNSTSEESGILGVHGQIQTPESALQQWPRRTARKRTRPRLYMPPSPPQSPILPRRRGRPPKAKPAPPPCAGGIRDTRAEDVPQTSVSGFERVMRNEDVPQTSVSGFESVMRNVDSCDNKMNEGIVDPKILDHVATTLQYITGSQTSVLGQKIFSSDLDKNVVRTLKAINKKHGDITQGCSLESDCMKTLILIGICKVVQDLQKKQLDELDIQSLDSYYTAVRDAEKMNVNVQWLHKRLDEIKDAVTFSSESKGITNERNKRLATIDTKKKELSRHRLELERLESEVQDLEEQLAQEAVMVEELNKKLGGQMSTLSKFQHTYLMDGLL